MPRIAVSARIEILIQNVVWTAHEFVLVAAHEFKKHATALMRQYPDMEHADPNILKVALGGTSALNWKFTQAGMVEFACLIPGYYEAGMKGHIRVSAKSARNVSTT